MKLIAITCSPNISLLPMIISRKMKINLFKIKIITSYLIRVAFIVKIRSKVNYDKYLCHKRKNIIKKKA